MKHETLQQFSEGGNLVAVKCSCGNKHPVDHDTHRPLIALSLRQKPFRGRSMEKAGSTEHHTRELIKENGEIVGVRCSCGFRHPVDEGRPATGFVQGCSCGRIHSLNEGRDGKLHMDTGWY